MNPQELFPEYRALLALTDSIRHRIHVEQERLRAGAQVTVVQASSVRRARGHLQLALEAFGQPSTGTLGGLAVNGSIGLAPATGSSWTPLPPLPGSPESMAPAAPPPPVPEVQQSAATQDPAPPAPAETAPPSDTTEAEAPSLWVQSRLDEIGSALEAALGGGDDPFAESPIVEGAACSTDNKTPEFVGRTDVLSIPDLVGFFQLQAKTGVLKIEGAEETFRLEFYEGSLIHAASTDSPPGERLGEILERRGSITRSRLQSLLEQLGDKEKLGDALLRAEDVSSDDLAAALQEQVLGIFVRLAHLPGCHFTFREGGVDADVADHVRYNVTGLLLDSARQIDEARESA